MLNRYFYGRGAEREPTNSPVQTKGIYHLSQVLLSLMCTLLGIEHRNATQRRCNRHLVLQHIPMLSQLAVFNPEEIDHYLGYLCPPTDTNVEQKTA